MSCEKQPQNQPIDELVIVKETSSLGKLLIKSVSKEEAKRMIVENHYSHKWNEGGFGKYNFGVFRAEEPDMCLGVAVYGYPADGRGLFRESLQSGYSFQQSLDMRLKIGIGARFNQDTVHKK
jgi:hypothetical protein